MSQLDDALSRIDTRNSEVDVSQKNEHDIVYIDSDGYYIKIKDRYPDDGVKMDSLDVTIYEGNSRNQRDIVEEETLISATEAKRLTDDYV
jgi:hypothetical protein